MSGLSPRVRGNPPRHPWRRTRPGSIPACAGEPGRWTPSRPVVRVYPRVCGGTVVAVDPDGRTEGLSPRVRGNRYRVHVLAVAMGSIPACAGEPLTRSPPDSCARVYPRVCGGTVDSEAGTATEQGLSPRVRGNLLSLEFHPDAGGSIPACAGEPPPVFRAPLVTGVYPRVCGGTASSARPRAAFRGLSPRVRGNLGNRIPRLQRGGSIPACAGEPNNAEETPNPFGSIPACAGEPGPVDVLRRTLRVYPRVCGGTTSGAASATRRRGLSLRVRGNPEGRRQVFVLHGSIPACAGEPDRPRRRPPGPRVYPRVCGGTAAMRMRLSMWAGLSPRVRGNLRQRGEVQRRRGSIPACAGEPH